MVAMFGNGPVCQGCLRPVRCLFGTRGDAGDGRDDDHVRHPDRCRHVDRRELDRRVVVELEDEASKRSSSRTCEVTMSLILSLTLASGIVIAAKATPTLSFSAPYMISLSVAIAATSRAISPLRRGRSRRRRASVHHVGLYVAVQRTSPAPLLGGCK